jgi:DNA polymerase III epsilon subunit-like protein
MKRFLTYDLETTFLQKGQKRTSQRILEIALYTPAKQYQRMVNPCEKYNTANDIITSLNTMKQAPDATLRFWTKLLVEKKALPTHLKRQNTLKQADAISKLLVRSDIAKEQHNLCDKYSQKQWLYALEEHHDKVNVAQQYLEKYQANETPKSLIFDTTKSVLTEVLSLGEKYLWIAHNGKAFDMPIVLGNCSRCNITPDTITFEDSLPMFRRKLNLNSYSQPLVYKALFSSTYKAHHALEDAKALYKILNFIADEKGDILSLFKVKKLPIKIKTSDLLSIKGVGNKSVAVFNNKGIHNKAQLDKWITKHTIEEFKEKFNKLYAYKKLAERLYNTQKC